MVAIRVMVMMTIVMMMMKMKGTDFHRHHRHHSSTRHKLRSRHLYLRHHYHSHELDHAIYTVTTNYDGLRLPLPSSSVSAVCIALDVHLIPRLTEHHHGRILGPGSVSSSTKRSWASISLQQTLRRETSTWNLLAPTAEENWPCYEKAKETYRNCVPTDLTVCCKHLTCNSARIAHLLLDANERCPLRRAGPQCQARARRCVEVLC